MDKKYKIAVGTDAFPPTTDGITRISRIKNIRMKFSDIKAGGFLPEKVTALAGLSRKR